MTQKNYDVCIIGAGASGLAAANSLDDRISVCIIDKNEIPGRKILVTGGGRCNLSNAACDRLDMTLDFFHSLGLETRCDDEGRYYPYSAAASDVVKALVDGLVRANIQWMLGREVTEVKNADPDSGYLIYCGKTGAPEGGSKEVIGARYVIIATGGKAAPAFGSTGDGFAFARKLGHRVERTYPILTGISCDIPEEAAGVRAKGEVCLLEDGQVIAREKGEIQFTKDGLSGICVFDLTPHIKARDGEDPRKAFDRFNVRLDLAPEFTQEEMTGRDSSFGILTEKLAGWIPPEKVKCMEFPVENVWGWEKAQCTAGGVSMEDVDLKTMESKICGDLFFTGEVLDRHGRCGGFNLQNAWETGIIAGRTISGRP